MITASRPKIASGVSLIEMNFPSEGIVVLIRKAERPTSSNDHECSTSRRASYTVQSSQGGRLSRVQIRQEQTNSGWTKIL
jgi:hypothetical protein